jgi:catechol 2,3-dioxygenase-like lactoylglutathione lyase family enzyme
MIKGIHGLLYSSDPEATRAFFRDKMKLPGSDIGGGWWIFDFAEGDLGVHPTDHGGTAGAHDVSFYCDDIEGVVAGMKKRGVVFKKPIEDHGYGLVTYVDVPGGITVQLYEPRYQKGASSSTRKGEALRKASKKAGPKKAAGKKIFEQPSRDRATSKRAARGKSAPPKAAKRATAKDVEVEKSRAKATKKVAKRR